jgi:hypothetical protein
MDGHRTVGMVADLILQNAPATRDAVKQILNGASLSEAAVWADCAKGICHRPLSPDEKAFVAANPQHKEFHYTDVPIQQSQYQQGTAGTRDDDVVQIINETISILRGRTPNNGPAVLSQRQALWVLAHMVGDIHQPLHVGAIYFDRDCEEMVDPNVEGAGKPNFGIGSIVASTNGGNDLKMPNGDSFHVKYWDDDTVAGATHLAGIRRKSIEDFAASIVANPPTLEEMTGDAETWAALWATEIIPISKEALTRIDIGDGMPVEGDERTLKCTWPVTVDRSYTQWANRQALTQLGKAGFRLAAVLQAIFEPR